MKIHIMDTVDRAILSMILIYRNRCNLQHGVKFLGVETDSDLEGGLGPSEKSEQ